MIAIIDYGMGNLRSVEKALEKLGHASVITSHASEIAAAERVILPGVGAFGAAMANLNASRDGRSPLSESVRDAVRSGKPFLGICLGMQLLFETSDELGEHRGLGLLPGRVFRFDFGGDRTLKIPHMGWNELAFPRPTPLMQGLTEGTQVYFVHGYYCAPNDPALIAATCDHGGPFCAAISAGNVHAVQFHPEKSGAAGLKILSNFAGFAT
jgi:imidazole glycerol-phosphate synthase subunit HisH